MFTLCVIETTRLTNRFLIPGAFTNIMSFQKQIQNELKIFATKERAEHEKRYLKSKLKFYGVTVPKARAVTKSLLSKNDLTLKQLKPLQKKLWNSSIFEEMAIALFFFDLKEMNIDTWKLMHSMQNKVENWAHGDWLASNRGKLLIKYPKQKNNFLEQLQKWSKSSNLWTRRAAAVTLVYPIRRNIVTEKQVFKILEPMMEDREYFVQMGCGWMLRELAAIHFQSTFTFLKKYKHVGRDLIRNAIRKYPKKEKSFFMN